jgi:FtsH-binding integral membrane protein
MKDRIARLAILILAVGFAASPIFSNGFGGFYRESFPVQVARWPAQPVGWAFSIWGLIYLALIATAAWAVLRPATMPGWRRATLPLGISLVIGLFWIEAAMRSPLLATAMILPMAAGAIVAMHRVGPDWREHAALGLYAGWLTAASGVALSVVLTGYGLLSTRVAAIALIAAVLVVAVFVALRRPAVWTYRFGVIWALFGVIVANLSAGDYEVAALCAAGAIVLIFAQRGVFGRVLRG